MRVHLVIRKDGDKEIFRRFAVFAEDEQQLDTALEEIGEVMSTTLDEIQNEEEED